MDNDQIQTIKDTLEKFYKLNNVQFDEGKHVYTVNGSMFTGVTTITDVRSKAFLAPWAAKESYLYLKENWDISKEYSEDLKEELLLAAKTAWTRKSGAARDSGTIAHDWVSNYILGKQLPKPEDAEALEAVRAFLVWEKSRQPLWILSEKIVVSLKNKFAGMLDCLCYLDGKVTLLDLKTSKQVSEGFLLQLAGYEMALEEMGIHVEQRIILRLPKDGKYAEEIKVSEDPELRLLAHDTFLHCRELHRFDVYVKNHLLDEKGKLDISG